MKRQTRIKPATKKHSRDLRREMTDAENILWHCLRKRQIAGAKFRRQHPIGSYIVDFVCIEAQLVVELDGGQHAEQHVYDKERTVWLNRQGYRVLRFWNNEVMSNTESVVERIQQVVEGDE